MTLRSAPLACAVLALLAGCAKSQPAPEVNLPPSPSSSVPLGVTPTAPPSVTLTNPELRVIVAAPHAKDFYFYRPEPKSFFTPSESEVAAFESKLPAYLRANVKPRVPRDPPLADRAPKYMRQYVGLVEQGGRRRIWGNYFCEYFGSADGGWRKEGFAVKDGGDCYFRVKFDAATGTFDELQINGEA